MSSCQWQKYKGANESKAKFRHNDKEQRLENNHQNPDIDKTKTHLNLNFTGRSYKEECQLYDSMIAETQKDSEKKLRKDAVTCIGLNIKLPEALIYADYELQSAWAKDCYDVVKKAVGEDRIVSATADFDEVHEYIDPDTGDKVLSRPEVDVRFIPVIDGTLQGSACASRANMKILNRNLEKMSLKKYGFTFMTGKQAKGKTTEELKAESRIAELEEQIEADQAKLEETQSKLEQAEKKLKTLQGENDRLRHFNASESDSERQIEGISEQAQTNSRGKQAESQLRSI